MNKNSKQHVCETIDFDGFDHAFRWYSDFKEVKDEKFHKLRKDYLKAAKKLEEYIGWDEYQREQEGQ